MECDLLIYLIWGHLMTNAKSDSAKVALVLTGGGARAAYQVGVLRAISDLGRFEKNPFLIISGFSAGAINGTWLASRCEDFSAATKSMWEAWATISIDKIFETETLSFINIALRWIKDRGLGGIQKYSQINYLLNTAPLNEFIKANINFDKLNSHIDSNNLYGVAVIASNYVTGNSTAFYNGHSEIQDWHKFNRISVRSKIKPEYVMASASIPIFFPPVKIGDAHYGDGMVRMYSPLSPAIHMGADKLMVIGARNPTALTQIERKSKSEITVSEIAGAILSGLFFDSIDTDIDRMQRINRTLSVMTEDNMQYLPDELRQIPLLNIKPSEELAFFSTGAINRLPLTMNYLLRGLGVSSYKGRDLLSFLSFETKFINSLLELGYEDARRKKDEILEFFNAEV